MISHPITRDRTRFSFSQKLWIPLFCSLLCVTGIFIFDAVQTRSLRIEERRNSLTQVDELALKTVAYYGGLAQGGKLTAEEAKQEAKAVIKGLRYGEDGYVAITDLDGVQVMNPMKPELDGKNRNDFQDAHGTYVFRDNAAIGRTESGVGFTSYVWPRPGETEAVPKMSRVVTYKPWGWTLVTGVYMDDIDAVFRKTLWLKGGVLLGVGALLALVMAYVNRSLGGTLGGAPEYATEVAARIAANDLSSAVAIEKDDRGSLLSAMKTMQANLAATIQGIRQSADAIATASQQVAAGNTDLSSRTEEQASALEETASSMEELNVTVRHNAENAQEANKLAASAYQSALDSNEVVSRLVDTMHLIDAKSNKIGDVIGIIDGIAFQTNILALNAAVEAA
ncbi:MAG: cache domain-containing protein, partial [Paucibacter sp.]|nr:cache domain-containing protein [Roseateles sp.]